MEGAEDGVSFASGMGAVFATFATFLNAGDHILSARAIFGSTHTLFTKYFPKWEIATTYFAVDALADLESSRSNQIPAVFTWNHPQTLGSIFWILKP